MTIRCWQFQLTMRAASGARWLPEKAQEADLWVETIPFNETRRYTERVASTPLSTIGGSATK